MPTPESAPKIADDPAAPIWDATLNPADPPLPLVVAHHPRNRMRALGLGTVSLVVGIAVAYFGASVLDASLVLRLLVGVIGMGIAYLGLSGVLTTVFGPTFDTAFWISVVWLALVIGSAALAPLLPLGEHNDTAASLSEMPYLGPDLTSSHPLGTNNFGLDMLARTVYGARASLVIAVVAVIIGLVLGGAVGIAAGFFRGKTDVVVGIFTNSLLAVPPLLLLISLATVLEPKVRNIAFALALLAIPGMIRIARANTFAIASREFVTAARAMGATRRRLMVREILPSVAIPLASLGMVVISVLIVAESSLSFLGLGIQPPDPSWGNMIAEGQQGVLDEHPHIVLVPGAVLFLTVFAFNIVGEKLRARLDPRGSKL